ncbi:hypothetical protein F2Q70_00039971 [Brassica cretica]|uniref:Uncharacterized protein n=1 Tax=Brassica cretica TaxID=69181 RepID=A0A8S9K3L1_BRACR|nr:hypothetical protein F2Q70_00039971 [Brassica cretica]
MGFDTSSPKNQLSNSERRQTLTNSTFVDSLSETLDPLSAKPEIFLKLIPQSYAPPNLVSSYPIRRLLAQYSVPFSLFLSLFNPETVEPFSSTAEPK